MGLKHFSEFTNIRLRVPTIIGPHMSIDKRTVFKSPVPARKPSTHAIGHFDIKTIPDLMTCIRGIYNHDHLIGGWACASFSRLIPGISTVTPIRHMPKSGRIRIIGKGFSFIDPRLLRFYRAEKDLVNLEIAGIFNRDWKVTAQVLVNFL